MFKISAHLVYSNCKIAYSILNLFVNILLLEIRNIDNSQNSDFYVPPVLGNGEFHDGSVDEVRSRSDESCAFWDYLRKLF